MRRAIILVMLMSWAMRRQQMVVFNVDFVLRLHYFPQHSHSTLTALCVMASAPFYFIILFYLIDCCTSETVSWSLGSHSRVDVLTLACTHFCWCPLTLTAVCHHLDIYCVQAVIYRGRPLSVCGR